MNTTHENPVDSSSNECTVLGRPSLASVGEGTHRAKRPRDPEGDIERTSRKQSASPEQAPSRTPAEARCESPISMVESSSTPKSGNHSGPYSATQSSASSQRSDGRSQRTESDLSERIKHHTGILENLNSRVLLKEQQIQAGQAALTSLIDQSNRLQADIGAHEKELTKLKASQSGTRTHKSTGRSSGGPALTAISFGSMFPKAMRKDSWLELGFELLFPQIKKIYIRDSYECIAEQIIEGTHARSIVTGTPGCGKSLFLFFLLWSLLKKGQRVVFWYHPWIIYFDQSGKATKLTNFPSISDSFWGDLWCLFDSNGRTKADLDRIPYQMCKTVVSISPREDILNDFRKISRLPSYCMPIWSRIELEELNSLYKVNDWTNRFAILGGVPRYVFQDIIYKPEDIIHAACARFDLTASLRVIGPNVPLTGNTQVLHRLVHMQSEKPYKEFSNHLASEYVVQAIARQVKIQARQDNDRLIAAYDGKHVLAPVIGHIFQVWAFEQIERGGVFTCRKVLHPNSKKLSEDEMISIPPSRRLVVDKVERNQENGRLHVPVSNTFKGFDGWIPGIGGLQMTVSLQHGIDATVDEKLKCLGGPDAQCLFWVLPKLRYRSFKKRAPYNIKQYALLIPDPPGFA